MNDPGVLAADRGAVAVERRLRRIYSQAQKELKSTIQEYNLRFMKKDEEMRRKVAEGTITEQEYKRWLRDAVYSGKAWDEKVRHCTDVLAESNREALSVVRDKQIDVFADNMTYQAYQLEKNVGADVGFSVYDAKTVGRLIKDQPELLPRKTLNGRKDRAWNKNKIANEITKSIIKGDGITDIANSLSKSLGIQNNDAMTRYARTAMTSAQNGGRMEMLHEAADLGIKTKKKWLATLDKRTRDTHAELDGQTAEIDEPFHTELGDIMFPGDPEADPALVYNCRCTLIYEVEGYENKGERRVQETGETIDSDTTYKEWKAQKENYSNISTATRKVEYGKLFNEKQKAETEKTLIDLAKETPLKKPLDFVGDARIIRTDIPEDMDHLDITADPELAKKYGGISAHYYRNTEGESGIEIFNEGLETHTLKEDFDIRNALREKYMDADGMLSEQNVIDSVSNTVEGTLRHEYCHALQDQYLLEAYREGHDDEAKEVVDKLFDYFSNNREKVMQISKYAASHPFEMLSESYVQIKDTAHPNTVASKTAREVWGIFTEHLRKKGVTFK